VAADTKSVETGRRVLALEAGALSDLAQSLGEDFARAVETILAAKGRVICAGIGKSGHVARKIAATFASTGTPAHFVHPAEASHGDLGMIAHGDVALALSKSGDTPELSDLVQYTRRFGVSLIAMTAERGSALARAADIRLILPNAREACAETNAPTTSTTLMIALGDALAVALLEQRGFRADDFKLFHPRGKLGAMLLTAGDLMHRGERLPLVLSGSPLNVGLAAMSQKGFGCVGVINSDGALCGMITDGDVRRLLAGGARAERVDDAMTRSPVTAAEGDLAAGILHTLNDRKIMQIFILTGGRPVGLIHMHDLIRSGVA
jgi:arabinose-5-phosphate isomerase